MCTNFPGVLWAILESYVMTVGERGSFNDIQGCPPVTSKGGFHPIVAQWASTSSKRRENTVQIFAHLLPAARRLKKGLSASKAYQGHMSK